MATANSTYLIGLGVPTVVEPTLTLLTIGSEGTPGAKRILTHPDSANFPAFSYALNPSLTSNLDNVVLTSPIAEVRRTLSSSKLLRFEGRLEDVVCTEQWGAQPGRQAAMPTYLFRQLYELLINPPPFSATAQTYITWQPRDVSFLTYNVELFRIQVGSGSGSKVFTVNDVRAEGTVIQTPLDGLDVTPSGLLDQTVEVALRIVSEVAS